MTTFETDRCADPNSIPDRVDDRIAFLSAKLAEPCSPAASFLGQALEEKYPGAVVLLYGSAGSVLAEADPTDIMFDFYVIVPSYKDAFPSPIMWWANILLPPNVFFHVGMSPFGKLQAKYAVLSFEHFDRLLSKRTFHSYFWARFAQPFKIVAGPPAGASRIISLAAQSIDVFLSRVRPLSSADAPLTKEDIDRIWQLGLSHSYRAELRAEDRGRAAQLLSTYGEWPQKTTPDHIVQDLNDSRYDRRLAAWAWRLRILQGGILSILRLLKASFTFQGGVDYIVWKIRRHSGIEIPVNEWHRRHPFIAAPLLGVRYYNLLAERKRQSRRTAD